MTDHDTPRIYIASLSDYNAGILHGAWIDLDGADVEDIDEQIQTMLGASPTARAEGSPAEGYAIHDHEGFGGFSVGEFSDLAELVDYAAHLAEHGPAFAAYVANADSGDDFEEAFQGEYDSEEAFAQELAEEIGALPTDFSWPASYIDWYRAADDLFMGDYWSARADGGSVYVFRSL
jgi:antirestriction protein